MFTTIYRMEYSNTPTTFEYGNTAGGGTNLAQKTGFSMFE